MAQNYKISPVKKTQNSKNIIALLNPYFPDIVSTFKFFEIFARHDIDLLDQIKHKGDFFKLFVCQRIKKLFDRASPCFKSIEFDFSHKNLLAYMRTYVKQGYPQRITMA
ncbi:MAG: hypothetical protein WAL93_01650 [Desulfobacterales bacterium]